MVSGSITPFQNQIYGDIKSYCLENNSLFEDECFPADDSSIARCQPISKKIKWKRPHEFIDNPVFIDGQIEPNDLDQGQLGNCWFITGAVAVASVPEYIRKVIPEDQSFNRNDYAGIFRFRFWSNGKWVEVVVDDRLPVDQNDRLIYCHNNKSPNEMFGPLLEKAYAKLNLCYEFLECGLAVDAMIDLTGGVHESFSISGQDKTIKKVPLDTLWEITFKSFERRSLAGSFINSGSGTNREHIQSNALVQGHAYCVLDAFEILPNGSQYDRLRNSYREPGNQNSIKLLRMRNPWGQNQSYKGGWEPNSPAWRKVSDEIQSQVNSRIQDDGQFLIAYSDFVEQFDQIDFVHIDFNAFYDETPENAPPSVWTTQLIYGAWVNGKNAGGCGNDDYRNYWLNPQYTFTLPADRDGGEASLIVALVQCDQVKNRLQHNGDFSESNIPQAFSIYKVRNTQTREKMYRDSDLEEVGSTGIYVGKKEVTKRFELQPGEYVIIPSLFDKGAESKFLIRLFFESDEIDTNSVQFRKLKTDPQICQELTKEIEGEEEEEQRVNDEPQYHQIEGVQTGNDNRGDHGRRGRGRRRRNVEPPAKIHNNVERGKFSNFLSNSMSVSEIAQNMGGIILNKSGAGEYVRSIKGSQACLIM